ncbi:MAG TPA: class I SAM-dependent methyltransferase [Pseudonocardiaceae bacterium]|nr:class I SAM-dependent methyltransferase [Pseudonocardiaceae bacterium]
MGADEIRTLISAAGGGVADVEAAITAIGANTAAELAMAELKPRLRLADVSEFDSDIVVRLRLGFGSGGSVEHVLVVKPGATGWWLGAGADTGAPAAAVVSQELAEFVHAVFAPGAVRAATRSVTWRDADDFSTFHAPGPAFTVVQRLLDALDHRERPGLNSLAVRYGSDKWGLHNYTPHYEAHFAPLRDLAITVLEIGVGGFHDPSAGGASLRMWRDYFPRAMVYGLDIVDKRLLNEGRIQVLCGDQSDGDSLRAVLEQTGPPDIVIDDASHISKHVITTFSLLFPHLRPGGLYAIEDLQTSYWPSFGGNDLAMSDPGTTMGLLKDLVDGLNHQELTGRSPRTPRATDRQISGIHFYHNLAVIEKGANDEPGAPSWLARTPPER